MGNLVQTSGFELSKGEALQLLRHFPLVCTVESSPVLLYRLDGDLATGKEVSYRLVSGFRIVEWKGVISSFNEASWTVDLKSGPFSLFHAEHSLSDDGGVLECFDDISFGGESPELERALKSARVRYAFAGRKELVRRLNLFESSRKTESFRVFESGLSAG